MMLDHYAFTGDDTFARQTLVPLASAILTFFDQHWQRDANGKIRFDPAMALETYREAVNPLVEIVGIQKVCEEMLALPEALATAQPGNTSPPQVSSNSAAGSRPPIE